MKTVLLCILMTVLLYSAEPRSFSFSYSSGTSPQLADYYGQVINNLDFYLGSYSGSGGSNRLRNNPNLILFPAFSVGLVNRDFGSSSFELFSYSELDPKVMKSHAGLGYAITRSLRISTGVAPEFRFPLGSTRLRVAVQPRLGLTGTFLGGTLDSDQLLHVQTGGEIAIQFPRGYHLWDTSRKTFALSLFCFYERTVAGDENYSTLYATVLERSAIYPEHVLITGITVRTIRQRNRI